MLHEINAPFSLPLKSEIELYIPGTIDVNKDYDSNPDIVYISGILTKMFGGTTISEHIGTYMVPNDIEGSDVKKGDIVEEKITVISVNCTTSDLEKYLPDVYDECCKLKVKLNQDVIAIRINRQMGFI